jgi:hypothetical protein
MLIFAALQNQRFVMMMIMSVFWFVVLYSLVEFYRRFRGACYFHGDIMQAGSTYETSIQFNQTIRRYNTQDSLSHIRRRENLKSPRFIIIIMIIIILHWALYYRYNFKRHRYIVRSIRIMNTVDV